MMTPLNGIYCCGVLFMKKTVPTWQMVGVVFAGIFGTLLHFTFDWLGSNWIAALFSAVNESIWEHTKLLFYPMLIYAFIEYKVWGREAGSFWWIKLLGALLGMFLIPVIYYTYTGALGVSADWFNITIFFIAAAAVYCTETKLFRLKWSCPVPQWVPIAILFLIFILYSLTTFCPPRIPLFQDPVTGTYGYFE